ncbi:dephospho-CoA kinase [Niveispirillum irakense]|uniref:dephospho-CoA kinase n=1 Tax=Niveispirillum irakense TaxID=34011 RepID=UPI0003F5F63A|nr:dephospho-CoA kinase [Niveispirillum irakense]
MIVLGLTGSIGMGKSTAASMLRGLGCPVHDADAAVHALYRQGGAAVPVIAKLFPSVIRDGAVDRAALGRVVLGDTAAMRRLEAAVHPLVQQQSRAFLVQQARRGVPLVVMDVPLLFEGGGWKRVDYIAVVTAPPSLQRARVLARPGMTVEKFNHILARQMPDVMKRQLADFVIPTGLGRHFTLQHLQRIVTLLRRQQQGRIWPPRQRPRFDTPSLARRWKPPHA